MFAIALQSGSNGNCIYVESAETRLLFDAGISGVAAERRLAKFGRDIRKVDAVIISHDHADHVRCAGVYHRKYRLPVCISRRTFDAAIARCGCFEAAEAVHHFEPGCALRFGAVTVETVPTPHDAAEGVAFVVAAGGKRLGILTDLGHVFSGLEELVGSLDAVFVESNYDPEMLDSGRYPAFLKARIRGPRGHISNIEAAELLRASAGGRRMKWVCLAHLSEENNQPGLALRTHRRIAGGDYSLYAASRYEPTGVFEI
ncbi:MAG: MBL fold metallo-hydrolase [Candidatus Brocadiia bacterium]|jgi:phosphoribosyl 1,2-cyclic phosphodiesterase